jgi:ABC-2 type transport system ATP-binding protein
VVVSGLRRSVGRQRLLDGLDLRVPVGARMLLVSDPEASSTLLLGILAGLARARRGSFELAGLSRSDDRRAWQGRVAYLPPDGGFYPWLSPLEVLELAGRLAGYDRAERQRRSDAAIEHYRLGEGLMRPVSRGGPALAQKVGLAAALLADPEVLLLDEPLRALDDAERSRLLDIPGPRRTVVLASRYPGSEDGLVDQVAFIREGRLALHVRRQELSEHELPLSMRGLATLADLHAASSAPVAVSA